MGQIRHEFNARVITPFEEVQPRSCSASDHALAVPVESCGPVSDQRSSLWPTDMESIPLLQVNKGGSDYSWALWMGLSDEGSKNP